MSFFKHLRGGNRNSASRAKERLQFVLIHDRTDLSPGKLEALKDEIIEVISRYIEIDKSAAEISLTESRDQQRLVANIPLASRQYRRL